LSHKLTHKSLCPNIHKTWNVAGIILGLAASSEVEPVIVMAVVPNDREHEYTTSSGHRAGPTAASTATHS
jgi:hypothetical protein